MACASPRGDEKVGKLTQAVPWEQVPDEPHDDVSPHGTLEGYAEVTHTGSFRYTLPLWVPRGRAGMQPDLALVYDSSVGNGTLGLGWAIQGLSQISRCRQNMSRDGRVDGIDFDAKDNFCLDGQKLVPVEPMALPEGLILPLQPFLAEYRTERESFTRVLAFGLAGEPTAWITLTRDGLVHRYGEWFATADGFRYATPDHEAITWHRHETADRAGNAIRYAYVDDPGSTATLLLSAITYTHSSDQQYVGVPAREIRFTYEPRPDVIDAWVNGLSTRMESRLVKITMWAPPLSGSQPLPVRTYELGYDFSWRSKRSLLKSIRACVPGMPPGADCIPETTFRYAEPDGGVVSYENVQFPVPEPLNSYEWPNITVLDANGDGFDDIIYETYADFVSNGWKIYHEPVIRFSSGDMATAFSAPSTSLSYLFPKPDPIENESTGVFYQYGWAGPFELQGDEKSEWIVMARDWGARVRRIYEWSTQSQQYVNTQMWPWTAEYDCSNVDISACLYAVLDFDGDGRLDLATPQTVPLAWQFYINDPYLPSGWQLIATSQQIHLGGPRPHVADMDGNGTRDLIDAAFQGFNVIELDDDSFTDDPYVQVTNYSSTIHGFSNVLADVNGDGLADSVQVAPEQPGPGGPTVLPSRIHINTGNGLKAYYESILWTWSETPMLSVRVSDFNGDRRDDLLLLGDADDPAILWLSDGVGFYELILFSAAVARHEDLGWVHPALADVDNDGKPELLTIAGVGTSCGNTAACAQGFTLYLSHQPEDDEPYHDLLVEVVDGRDKTDLVTYDKHGPHGLQDADPTYTPGTGCAYPERCLHAGPPLVREHTVSDPDVPETDRTYGYRYRDARGDLRGRGRVGFTQITMTDSATGATVVADFDLSRYQNVEGVEFYPLAGTPVSRTVEVPVGTSIVWIEDTFERNVYGTGGRFWTQLAVHTTRWLELNSPQPVKEVVRSYLYDGFANVRLITKATTGGFREQVSRQIDNDDTNWLIGLIAYEEHTSTAPDQSSDIRATRNWYDPVTGLLDAVWIQPYQYATPDTNRTITYHRGAAGLVTSVEDQDAYQLRTETFQYEIDGIYVERYQNAVGHVSWFGYRPDIDRLAIAADPNSVIDQWKYDAVGRITKEEPADGPWVIYAYEATIPAVTIKHVNHELPPVLVGPETQVGLDAFGRAVSEVSRAADGSFTKVIRRLDAAGRETFVSVPRDNADPNPNPPGTSRIYDDLGRLTQIFYADGTTEQWAHPQLLATTHTDPRGHATTYYATADGQLESTFKVVGNPAVGRTQSYTYGPFGLPTSITDFEGNVTSMQYDALGRRTLLQDPNQGNLQEEHTAFGELRWQQDAVGNTRTMTYDLVGRLEQRTSEDGSDYFMYDLSLGGQGQLSLSVSADGVAVNHAYDSLGRLAARTYIHNGEQRAVSFDYDALGRLSRTHYPQVGALGYQLVVRNEYGQYGHLHRVVNDGTGIPLWTAEARDRLDRVTHEVRGNLRTMSCYDELTQRHERTVTATLGWQMAPCAQNPLIPQERVFDQQYDYQDGRLNHRFDWVTSVDDTFTYDQLGRLRQWISMWPGGGNPPMLVQRERQYDLSPSGALLGYYDYKGGPQETHTQYGYPQPGSPRPHGVTTMDGGYSFAYDAAGRQQQRVVNSVLDRHIDFNSHDLPKSGMVSGQTFDILYDAHGGRFRKTTAAVETTYIGGLYEERIVGGGGKQYLHYVYGESGLIAQIEWIEASQNTVVKYVYSDDTGSPALIADVNGAVLERLFYEPYGQRINLDRTPATPPASFTPGLTGHEHDEELGLINMNGRVYDPLIRRFLTPDPLLPDTARGEGIDRFAYVSGDPINRSDLTGFGEHDWVPSEGSGSLGYWHTVDGPRSVDLDFPDAPAETGSSLMPPSSMPDAGATPSGGYDAKGWEAFEMGFIKHGETAMYVALAVAATAATAGIALEVAGAAAAAGGTAYAGWGAVTTGLTAARTALSAGGAVARNHAGALAGSAIMGAWQKYGAQALRWGQQTASRFGSAVWNAGRHILSPQASALGQMVQRLAAACFVAGTLVATSAGAVPIEQLEVGDRVWSNDTRSGALTWAPVTAAHAHAHQGLVYLVGIGDARVEVTGNHPMCVAAGARLSVRPVPPDIADDPIDCGPGGRWVEARDLLVGDSVLGTTGASRVVSLSTYEASLLVYNIEVDGTHTYAVSPAGMLVHNKSAAAVRATGQLHHAVSNPVSRALQQHPVLKGVYQARDPRFVLRAADEAAHRGYQTWHRALDKEVVNWLGRNLEATPAQFEAYLRGLYQRPDNLQRFPLGFE